MFPQTNPRVTDPLPDRTGSAGKLVLSVDKDTYETLGLEGKPSQYQRKPAGRYGRSLGSLTLWSSEDPLVMRGTRRPAVRVGMLRAGSSGRNQVYGRGLLLSWRS